MRVPECSVDRPVGRGRAARTARATTGAGRGARSRESRLETEREPESGEGTVHTVRSSLPLLSAVFYTHVAFTRSTCKNKKLL